MNQTYVDHKAYQWEDIMPIPQIETNLRIQIFVLTQVCIVS